MNTLGQFDPVYFLTLYHFKYTYPISLKNFFKRTSINVESTDVVIKCLWNYAHSQNYYKNNRILSKKQFFLVFNTFG